jgi:hypothetical protein
MNTKIFVVAFLLTATALANRLSAADLHVHLINEAGAAAATLDAAESEARRIWETAGLHLIWTSSPERTTLNDGDTVVVVVRFALHRPPGGRPAESLAASRPALGWIVFGDDGKPGNLIEVSFEALTSVVMSGERLGRHVRELPKTTQWSLFGCGLGRVVAHEIGHWLMGRGHTKAGLMRASFGGRDVLDPLLARLPDEWTAAGSKLRLALSSPCQLHASRPSA